MVASVLLTGKGLLGFEAGIVVLKDLVVEPVVVLVALEGVGEDQLGLELPGQVGAGDQSRCEQSGHEGAGAGEARRGYGRPGR